MTDGTVAIPPAALDQLMPLHARVDSGAVLRGLGPTLARLLGGGALGQRLDAVFAMTHPARVTAAADLLRMTSLRLVLRGPVATPFKGVAVALADGGALLNLSFSYRLQDAVRDHRLSASDFAPTDLANEYLYLVEANTAILAEARRASDRLRGARALALEQALTDPLTGLRNRRGLDRALAALAASGQPFGLIHIDLDHFKRINDTQGHSAGDAVLKTVARTVMRELRIEDCFGRIGGEEFAILIANADAETAADVAERVRAAIERTTIPGHESIRVTASFGIAEATDGVLDVEDLTSRADAQLYSAKASGRNRVHVAEDALPRAVALN